MKDNSLGRRNCEVNWSDSEDSWENCWEVNTTIGGYGWDTVRVYARMWNHKRYFYLETVTGELLTKK